MKIIRKITAACEQARFLERIAAVTILFVGSSCIARAAQPVARPNVVFIYSDDVGYADVSLNGATKISTPHIDALAASGLNFTDAHSTASTCTPSRFSLLTGIHGYRHNIAIASPNASLLISTKSLTLPKLFKKAGYRTAIVGKWHLGLGKAGVGPDWNGQVEPGPLEVGFDSAFIIPATGDRVPCVFINDHGIVGLDPQDPIYVSDKLDEVQKPGSTQYPDAHSATEKFYHSVVNGIGRIGYMSGGKAALWDDYTIADVLVGKANKFIADSVPQPFFLYLSTHDIHIPNTPNQRFKNSTKIGARGDAMVQLDACVGAVLAELDRLGLAENTIVIFSSDNGPTHHDDSYPSTKEVALYSPKSGNGHDASGKWRGGKYEIYEGGNRLPLVIRWPNHIKPGTTSPALVSQIDFIASFAKLLGVELAPGEAPDSRDTLAAFLGQDLKGQSFIIEEGRGSALRVGNWKFIPRMDTKKAGGFFPVEDCLYNLDDDPGEQINVVGRYPEKAAAMAAQLKQLKASKGLREAR